MTVVWSSEGRGPEVIARKPEIVNAQVPQDGWGEMAELTPVAPQQRPGWCGASGNRVLVSRSGRPPHHVRSAPIPASQYETGTIAAELAAPARGSVRALAADGGGTR
jgi:hypothetical protein